ncbi:MAG: hypothetical protein HY287_15930 [Planctomycetes bacterium]|nr:hypothetical protein [Planctomycetota bacterium]MBI3835815.1 hypothetical protein [Planctomycetota bacterium]
MNHKQCEPSRATNTPTALKAVSKGKHTADATSIQFIPAPVAALQLAGRERSIQWKAVRNG